MISLRAYNREIEQLIENGQYDDAIAHSIHILVTYPKCIESYRNLGKSLLEQKKYPEALDVFSRVLSAIPDDFISHVGLSIIFEDQNNLDLAIWHMEQAFDVQPSNLAIQDELKRLFGRRDGEHPTKIRLTRGALVRMYARGELFQQAITEILSILEEDPRRIDLEVILARMYFFNGAISESETICNRILEKIPYCFEANKILQQILLNKNDREKAAIHLNRLISLDPYYQFSTSPFSDQEIPDNKVLLEKLDYVPTKMQDAHIPEWLEEINSNSSDKPSESFDWLTDLPKQEDTPAPVNAGPFSMDNQEIGDSVVNNLSQTDDEIPEWMKKAGWSSNDVNNNDQDANRLESNFLDSKDFSTDLTHDEWAKDEKPANGSTVTNEDLASLFTELQEGKMDNGSLTANGNEEKQFPPSDWKSQFSNSPVQDPSNSNDQDFPDWLKNFQAEEPQKSQSADDMPDWLRNLQANDEPSSDSIEPPQPSSLNVEENLNEETTFSNLFDEATDSVEPSRDQEIVQAETSIDDGWISEDLIKKDNEESVVQSTEFVEPAQTNSDDQIPDWVKSVLISQAAAEQSTEDVETEPVELINEVPFKSDSSENFEGFWEPLETAAENDDGIISQQTNDELLDWLRGLKVEDEAQSQSENVSEINEPVSVENTFAPLSEVQASSGADEPTDTMDTSFVSNTNIGQEDITLPEEEKPIMTLESDANSEVEFTEYANETIESESIREPVKEIQTSELHREPEVELSEVANNVTINQFIESRNFEAISTKVIKSDTDSLDIANLINTIFSLSNENADDFSYWQCLGDLYSKNNQLNDALLAYQKAEDILVKTISS